MAGPPRASVTIPRLKRAYRLTRRLRRFVRTEAATRRAWLGLRPDGLGLLPRGFTSDKAVLYPDVTDARTRADYVRDVTRFRYRMFNGKSGELLTQKDVLLRVLAQHLPWDLDHQPIRLVGGPARRLLALQGALGDVADGPVALLRSRDALPPRLLDPATIRPATDAHDRVPPDAAPVGAPPLVVPRGRMVIHRLGLTGPFARPPTIVQLATYWDGVGPFVGHAVVLRGGGATPWSWPRVGPGLEVTRLDPCTWRPAAAVRLTSDPRRGLRREATMPACPVAAEELATTADLLVSVARRFPNLTAVNWRLLVDGGRLHLVDAANRLDVTYPQLLGPLLDDPRLRGAYAEAGWDARASTLADR